MLFRFKSQLLPGARAHHRGTNVRSAQHQFLPSRLGHSFLLLFVVFAIFPIGCLSILSFNHVSSEFYHETHDRLLKASESVARSLLRDVEQFETQLDRAAALQSDPTAPALFHSSFESVTWINKTGNTNSLLGPTLEAPVLDDEKQEQLSLGRPLLFSTTNSLGETRFHLMKEYTNTKGHKQSFLASIKPQDLFDLPRENLLPPHSEYCILTLELEPMHCSGDLENDIAKTLQQKAPLAELSNTKSTTFDFLKKEKTSQIAGHWLLSLESQYKTSGWIVLVAEPRVLVLESLRVYWTVFPLLISLSLFLVCLLGLRLIREMLAPLERMKDAAERIAQRDFSQPITVESGSELNGLATSLNSMADELQEQFSSLSTMIEIDRLILSGSDPETIIDVTLACIPDLYKCEAVALMLRDSDTSDVYKAYISFHPNQIDKVLEIPLLNTAECSHLHIGHAGMTVDLAENPLGYLESFKKQGIREAVVFPITRNRRIDGLIAIGHKTKGAIDQDRTVFIRQLADQVGIAVDRARTLEEKRKLAYYDNLTDLPNRILFKEHLAQELRNTKRRKQELAVCLLDLDGFKRINDTLGHDAGDRFLCCVSERISRFVEFDKIARFGGDEFALYFNELTSREAPAYIVQLILDALSQPFALLGTEMFITASVGISIYPSDGDTVEELIKNADSALYHAKDTGKNNFQFFREELNTKVIEHFNMANALRAAVNNDEFRVHYQPIVETETDEIIGFEALLRWQKPDGYLVAPDDFLTVAEETGLIVPIGTFVVKEACRQLRFWHDAGFGELTMAVNLSSRQFREDNLVGVVRGALALADLDARYLHLELTESILMESGGMTQDILSEFRRMGIRIAIDDFGTGYSSLSYLQKFQLDALKIDRSFIKDIARNPKDASITRAIILMAHSLGLEIVAEGIETEEQKVFIREHGCRYAQGYLYSRPVPAEEISKMLIERLSATDYSDPEE